MTKFFAEQLPYIRWALISIGLFLALIGSVALDPATDAVPEIGVVLAVGLGLALGWPAGGRRFSLEHHAISLWFLADLLLRLSLIAALEMLLRHYEWRYAFKAQAGMIALLAGYFLYPALPRDSEKEAIDDKRDWHFAICAISLGLIAIAGAFLLAPTAGAIWQSVVIAVGLAVLCVGIAILCGLLESPEACIIISLAVGLVVAGIAGGLLVNWKVAILAIVVYAVFAFLACIAYVFTGDDKKDNDDGAADLDQHRYG